MSRAGTLATAFLTIFGGGNHIGDSGNGLDGPKVAGWGLTMSRRDDHAYYSRRTAEETVRGDRASDANVAAVHYELARRYSVLAAKTGIAKPRSTLIKRATERSAPVLPEAALYGGQQSHPSI